MRMEAGLDTGPVAAVRALADRRRRHGRHAVRQARRAGAGLLARDAAGDRGGRCRADPAGSRRGDAGAAADQGGRSPRLRPPGARGLRPCARCRSVAGRERGARRRAAQAVRATRRRGGHRRRHRRLFGAAGRGAGPAAGGAGRRLRGAARSRLPSCSSRGGSGCRRRRCSPGTASPPARSSRDRTQAIGPRPAVIRTPAGFRTPPGFRRVAGARAHGARARADRARTGRARRRLRQPRAVGGAGSRPGARRRGSGAGDGAGLRRAAPARAHRSGAAGVRDERARQADPRVAHRAAHRRVPDPVPRSRAGLRGRRRRGRARASRSRAAAWRGSRTRCCDGWGARASRRCPTPPPIPPAIWSRPPVCPTGSRRCCWPSCRPPRRSRSPPASPTPRRSRCARTPPASRATRWRSGWRRSGRGRR